MSHYYSNTRRVVLIWPLFPSLHRFLFLVWDRRFETWSHQGFVSSKLDHRSSLKGLYHSLPMASFHLPRQGLIKSLLFEVDLRLKYCFHFHLLCSALNCQIASNPCCGRCSYCCRQGSGSTR